MAGDKKCRRRSTPVIVRPRRTAPLSEEDYELAVDAIARMVARSLDANGRETTDNEIATETANTRKRLADQVEIGIPHHGHAIWPA